MVLYFFTPDLKLGPGSSKMSRLCSVKLRRSCPGVQAHHFKHIQISVQDRGLHLLIPCCASRMFYLSEENFSTFGELLKY